MPTPTSPSAILPQELTAPVEEQGFAIVPGVLDSEDLDRLLSSPDRALDEKSIRPSEGVYAIRNLLDVVPEIPARVAIPAIRRLIEPVLGEKARLVRALLFDKTRSANWKVPWHQDLSIAVKKKVDVEGFGPWSRKAGVVHLQPPAWILESMVAVRIHLDDCNESNGPLRVIPGSHRQGRLSTAQLSELGRSAAVVCTVPAGGVMLMRPLLMHASSACESPRRRRVIHIEFASCDLPGGLEWYADLY